MGNNSSLISHPSEITIIDSLVYILSDFLGTYVNIHECDPNIPKKILRPISAQQCIQNNPNWTPEAWRIMWIFIVGFLKKMVQGGFSQLWKSQL